MIVTIEFTKGKAWYSKLINAFQTYGASHVRISYETIEPVVLEADWMCVVERPYYLAEVVHYYNFEIPIERILEARKEIGKLYDYGNLFMLGIQKILKIFGIRWVGWKSNPNQYICVDIALKVLNLKDIEKTDIDGLISKINKAICNGELQET